MTTDPHEHRTRRSTQKIVLGAMLLIALGLLGLGIVPLFQHYTATHNPPRVINNTIVTHSTSAPNETAPINACAAYKVAAAYPEKISLPTIKAGGCLERVGVDQHGAIAVPDNIYTAAWYIKSALPGQSGLSVIDGHISGHYNVNGIFEHLHQLQSGDDFTVTLGGGKLLHYQVYAVQSVPLDQAVPVLFSKDAAVTSQLNLITCGGTYNKTTKLYDQRVIVSAKLE